MKRPSTRILRSSLGESGPNRPTSSASVAATTSGTQMTNPNVNVSVIDGKTSSLGTPVKIAKKPSVTSSTRRYSCPKCSYSTDRRDLFTRHENIHRDEKPFKCYVCNKMFNRADHVKKHFLRIHRGIDYDVKLTKRIKGVDYDVDPDEVRSLSPPPLFPKTSSGDHNNNHVQGIASISKFTPKSCSSRSSSITPSPSPPPVTSMAPTTSSMTTPILSSQLMSKLLEVNNILAGRQPAIPQSLTNLAQFTNMFPPSFHGNMTNINSIVQKPFNAEILQPIQSLKESYQSQSIPQPSTSTMLDCNRWKPTKSLDILANRLMMSAKAPSSNGRRESPVTSCQPVYDDEFDDESSSIATSSLASPRGSTTSVNSIHVDDHDSEDSCDEDGPVINPRKENMNSSSGQSYSSSSIPYKKRKVSQAASFTMSNISEGSSIVEHESTTYECEECGCCFADFPSLHTHRYLLHRYVTSVETFMPYRCVVCDRRTPTQRDMIKHMGKHQVSCSPRKRGSMDRPKSVSASTSRRKQVAPRKVTLDAIDC